MSSPKGSRSRSLLWCAIHSLRVQRVHATASACQCGSWPRPYKAFPTLASAFLARSLWTILYSLLAISRSKGRNTHSRVRRVIHLSKERVVAFQGEPGASSEDACFKNFGKEVRTRPLPD